MHFPVRIGVGSVSIDPHLLFEEAGFIIGFRYFLYLRRRQTDLLDMSQRIWILCGAALGALLLSRLLGALEKPDIFFNAHTSWLYYLTNKTIIGGLLGGLIGTELVKKFMKVQSSTGDMMTFGIILAMMIGRIGCFLEGLPDNTYGSATSLPWGIDMGDGIPRHPAALYEFAFLGLLWFSLYRLQHYRSLCNGSLFKLFMVSYLLFRFFIEFIKPVYRFSFGLSVLQLACLAGLGYYYKVFLNSPFTDAPLTIDTVPETE